MAGLLDDLIQQGIISYGARYAESPSDPLTLKGKGYFGFLPHADGKQATEISSTDLQGRHYPTLTPNLTQDEINLLLQGNRPTDNIYDKAEAWADYRRSIGMSPFADQSELRIPTNAFAGLLGQ